MAELVEACRDGGFQLVLAGKRLKLVSSQLQLQSMRCREHQGEETEKMVKEIEVGLAEAQASLKNA
eukprot:1678782-Amphidinium_carterae.1